jgi:hypothetical protein
MEVDLRTGHAAESPPKGACGRSGASRSVSAFEMEIREMYAQMLDEPVPPRLLGILRAALAKSSSSR